MKKITLALMLFVLTVTSVFAQQLTDGFETWPSPNWNIIESTTSNTISQSSTQANSGTYSLRFSSYSYGSPYDQYIVSNEINWTEAENEFSFWHRGHSSYGDEVIYVGWSTTGNDVDTDFTWSTIIEPTLSWAQYSKTDLPANTKYVAIHYNPGSSEYYCYIDDVVLGNPVAGTPDVPVLVSPISGAINLAIDTDLEWTTGENTDHAVLYLADNADFTDASVINPATSPYTTSLTNGTTYFWKVVAVSTTSIEISSAVNSFTTAFGAISSFPWTEDFEDDDLDWTILDNNNDGDAWLTNTTGYVHSGTQSTSIHTDYNSGANDDYLITPQLTLSDNMRLKFWYRTRSSGEPENFQVVLSTTGIAPADFTEIILPNATYSNTSYQEQTIDLSVYSGNVYIAFHVPADETDGYYLYIDDVTVEDIPATPIVEIVTDPIDFGTISLNNSSNSEIVSIQNIGGGILNISDIAITGTDADQFSYTDSQDYALEATEDLLIEVTFNPTSAGAKTATLQITDDLSREVYEIALTGTGIDTDIYELNIPYAQDFESEEGFLGWNSTLDSDNSSSKSERYSSSYSAHTGTYSHRFYHSSSATYTNAELISPIVVPDMDAYRVKFWAKKSNSSNTDPLLVGKYNQAMDTFTAYSTLALTTNYAEYTVNMNAPVRSNERIAFQANFSGAYQTIYIDDILLEEAPQGALIQITPDAHDFGQVFIAGSSSQTFTVANNGVLSAEITEVSVPAGYSLELGETLPTSLEAGSSFNVEVTFSPVAVMMYSGNLAVKETNPENQFVPIIHNVALTGTGIPVPEGDNHNNPFTLTLADSVTVEGSTTDFQNYYSFVSSQSVVYQLTLPTDKLMSLSLDGTTWDTKLWVFNSYQQIDDATTLATAEAWYYNDDEGSASTGGDRSKARDRATWSKMLETYTPAGEYYIVIAGYGSNNGDYTLTVETADIPLPLAVTNPTPDHEAISVATTTTLSWTNPNYTNNIDLYLGTPGNMTLVLDNVEAVEEYLATDLSTNTTYNWKVIARNITGDTPTEEVATWSFTTVGQAPEATTYTAPADEATAIALSGNLTWETATSADGYNVYLATNNSFTDALVEDVEGTSYAFSGLDYSTTYYWKVIPYNIIGSTSEGIDVWSFTTIPDPTLPMPISINFEGTTTVPSDYITSTNMTVTASGHGNTQNVLYKNIFTETTSAYIQFQAMNNITASSVIDFDYRFIQYSGYTGTVFEADWDYLIVKASTDNGENFTVVDQINSTNHVNSDDFTNYTVNIGDFVGQTAIFRFEMNDDTVNDYYFDIDNIYFGEPATTPLATLSATEIDFGTVGVGETASNTVSISNAGVGTLNISTIEIVGTNASEFSYSTEAEASMALTEGQILSITLDFTPQFEGQRDATLEITDDLGRRFRVNSASNNRNVNAVTLTGEGFVPAQGSLCSNPLPLDLPAVDVTGNTGDFGDDYESSWVSPSSNYLNGDDVVYQFTLENDMLLNGTIVAGGTWMGVFILEDAPNAVTPAEVVNLNIASTGYSVEYDDVLIPAGTYYMIISTYPTPQSIDYTINLTVSTPAPEIPVNVVMSMDAASITITWDAVTNASSYNVYGCDTPDGEYTLIPNGNVSGLSHTFSATDTMKFYKVKASSDAVPAKGFSRRGRN